MFCWCCCCWAPLCVHKNTVREFHRTDTWRKISDKTWRTIARATNNNSKLARVQDCSSRPWFMIIKWLEYSSLMFRLVVLIHTVFSLSRDFSISFALACKNSIFIGIAHGVSLSKRQTHTLTTKSASVCMCNLSDSTRWIVTLINLFWLQFSRDVQRFIRVHFFLLHWPELIIFTSNVSNACEKCTYLGALNFQFHVILARGFAIFSLFPTVAVTSIAHFFARVQ